MGAVRLAGLRRVQAGVSEQSPQLLRLGGGHLRRHRLQQEQGEGRRGAEDVEGHPEPGVQGRHQREARHLRHAARAVVHAQEALRQRLLAGVRQAAAQGLRLARPALRPARQGRRPRLCARGVRGLHPVQGEGRRDRLRRPRRRAARDPDLHRRREQGAAPGGGEALRGLGAVEPRAERVPDAAAPALRLAPHRRPGDGNGQEASPSGSSSSRRTGTTTRPAMPCS